MQTPQEEQEEEEILPLEPQPSPSLVLVEEPDDERARRLQGAQNILEVLREQLEDVEKELKKPYDIVTLRARYTRNNYPIHGSFSNELVISYHERIYEEKKRNFLKEIAEAEERIRRIQVPEEAAVVVSEESEGTGRKKLRFGTPPSRSLSLASSEEQDAPSRTATDRLRAILERARASCTLLDADTLTTEDIQRSLDETGVAVIHVNNADTQRIRREVGALVADTFPLLSAQSRNQLRDGLFATTSKEWTKRKVTETNMALRSYRMPAPVPLVASRQGIFTDPALKTVHLRNPLLAMAPICVWENLNRTNPALHPRNWFNAPERMICSEDGIKFANSVSYDPTRIHYDGQPERVQIMFTTDSGPVRLFAVPGSGTEEAQRLMSEILGIQLLKGFSTHKDAWDAHPEVRDMMHSFGVAVPANGLLLWKTRVWHFEGKIAAAAADNARPALVELPFDWDAAKRATTQSDIFRVYCGVVALPDNKRNDLIRHAFFRENQWPMEPFAFSNRSTPVFVAEKSSQAGERGEYRDLEPEWNRLKSTPFAEMKAFLRRLSADRLRLHGLEPEDLN
jgi:hypothetical protein